MRSDSDIKHDVEAELAWTPDIDEAHIAVTVNESIVTLSGFVNNYVESADLHGVRMVNNQIRLEPRVEPLEIKRRIEEAFRRSAELDAEAISVTAGGRDITLKGKVRTWKERLQAQQTAWSAPGVASVRNNIDIAGE